MVNLGYPSAGGLSPFVSIAHRFFCRRMPFSRCDLWGRGPKYRGQLPGSPL